jgi:glycosyltransferase involved in cell wall biosynthesis
MNIIFICQSTNINDPIVADTIDRINVMAMHPAITFIDVICLEGKGGRISDNVFIHPIRNSTQNRLITLLKLYYIISKIILTKNVHSFYLYMVPGLTVLLVPFKYFSKIDIVLWFGHTKFNFISKIGACYIADKWITSNKHMTPVRANNQHFAGQGIDTNKFKPIEIEKLYDVVTVGRITPIKNIELLLDSLKECETRFKKKYSLLICGDAYSEKDKIYKALILNKIADLNLVHRVTLLGSVQHNLLVQKLNQARVFVFTVPGGIGKASLEAMACGIPVILAEPKAKDFYPDDLARWFICDKTVKSVSDKINFHLEADYKEMVVLNNIMLELVKDRYSLQNFMDRVVEIIQK